MQHTMRHLFQGFGLELEYMIVDKDTLDVKPICNTLLASISAKDQRSVTCGDITYSNELALHVVELKTTAPCQMLNGAVSSFQEHVTKINTILLKERAKLLPTAAHPWMDPVREMKLWNGNQSEIYNLLDHIFDCRSHAWANLQSAHINLPFCGESEFVKLHEAIRLVIPILAALGASSPILDGKKNGALDARLDTYILKQKRFPTIAGKIVPESITCIDEYKKKILQPMYDEIAPFDSQQILQHDWLNARGAVARFERSSIEVRVLDVQECPKADIAIAQAVIFVLQELIQKKLPKIGLESLCQIFVDCVKDAEKAIIFDDEYLEVFGLKGPTTAKKLWQKILKPMLDNPSYGSVKEPLEHILEHGSLASRILRSWKMSPTKRNLYDVYEKLSDCLAKGVLFN